MGMGKLLMLHAAWRALEWACRMGTGMGMGVARKCRMAGKGMGMHPGTGTEHAAFQN